MFKQYLSLKIINAMYWIVLAVCALVFLYALKIQNVGVGAVAIFIFVFSRMSFEVMAVQFQQAETLTKILAVLEGKQARADEDDDALKPSKKIPSEWLK